MPALSADWPDVKATAISTGSLKQAAEAHGLEYGAVRVRAHREGWPVGRRVHKQAQEARETSHAAMVKQSQGRVTSVTSAAQAAENTLAEDGKASRLALSSALRNAAEHVRDAMTPSEVIEQAQNVKATVSSIATVHGWQEKSGSSTTVNVLIQ